MSARGARVIPWKFAADRVAAIEPLNHAGAWLTMDQAGAHLGYSATPYRGEVARQFCRRVGIPLRRRGGRALLVRTSDLDVFLETGRAPRR